MATMVVFTGEYDIACQNELRRELDRLAFEPNVILDLTSTTFIDSTVLSELLRLHRLRQANELSVLTFLLTPSSPIRRLFEITAVADTFRIFETVDEAVENNGETVKVRYAFTAMGTLAAT